MSAAEPAHPEPDRARPATVITFPPASRPPRRTQRRERPTAVPPDPQHDAHQRLAATLESVFATHGRSLTDHDTAQDYTITLGEVRRMLEGAHIQGIIGDEAHRELDAMIKGMLAAPGLLA